MKQDGLGDLGLLVETALDRALDALNRRDLKLADDVVRGDLEINAARYRIEEDISRRLPGSVSSTIPSMVTALNVITELERMGDHAEGIAKVTLMLGKQPSLTTPAVIKEMGVKTASLVHRALDALNREDAEAARAICREDDDIDALYDRAYQELLSIMVADQRLITEATYLLWVTHNLERISDRATNICERVVYLATGRVEELNVSKY